MVNTFACHLLRSHRQDFRSHDLHYNPKMRLRISINHIMNIIAYYSCNGYPLLNCAFPTLKEVYD